VKKYLLMIIFLAAVHPVFPVWGAGPFDNLFVLYEQKEFSRLNEELNRIAPQYPEAQEIKFFKSLFLHDGQAAKDQYSAAFEKGSPAIKFLAAKKLMDYFYARGYYGKASEYQKYLAENEMPAITEDVKPDNYKPDLQRQSRSDDVYYIQIGAFGMRENAKQRCDMLATQHITAEIVIKKSGSKNLFCVWIKGYPTFDETIRYANTIKSKYDLDFRILKK
jgi:hypothetical protein